MAEVALYGLDIITGPNSIDGIGVPKIVETRTNQSGRLHRRLIVFLYPPLLQRAACLIGKHQIMGVIPKGTRL